MWRCGDVEMWRCDAVARRLVMRLAGGFAVVACLIGCQGKSEEPVLETGEPLKGPWDGVEFAQNNPYDCVDPTGVPTEFPAHIGEDWDIPALEKIPVEYINELTDTALEASDHGPAACAMQYFQTFADNNAFYLEGDCTENGEAAAHDYERSLFTTGMIGLPVLKLKGDPFISDDEWENIEPWLRSLVSCHQVMLKDRLAESYISGYGGYHNSVYNVSLAGISFAIALNDQALFDEFVAGYQQALDHLNDDGSSPYELNEKGDATLFYHNYISNYASHVALLTDMNGHDFLHHEKLVKMRGLVMGDLGGGTTFADLAGEPQTRNPTDEPHNLTWTYHVGRIDSDAAVMQVADQYGPDLIHAMTAGLPERWWGPGTTLRANYGAP